MGRARAVVPTVGTEPCAIPDQLPEPSPRASGTLVILPAFNEEASLGAVLKELRAAVPALDVLVVDDGSSDATAAVARGAGVRLAPLPFNLGVGGALQTGFRYAVRHRYDRAVQIDADGQHDPSQIPLLLAALDDGADLVIGTRFGDGTPSYQVGRVRSGAMRVLRMAVHLLSGQTFSDTSSGFRAFSAEMVDFFSRDYPTEYLGDTAEALLLACNAGFTVVEVPVRMRERTGGCPSNRSFKLAYHYLRVLVTMVGRAPLRRRHSRPAPPR